MIQSFAIISSTVNVEIIIQERFAPKIIQFLMKKLLFDHFVDDFICTRYIIPNEIFSTPEFQSSSFYFNNFCNCKIKYQYHF